MAKRKSTTTLEWEDNIGIEQASSLKEELLEAINKYKTTLLDISQITDMDTSIIQLILSAQAEAKSQEKEFFISGEIPEGIKNLFDLLSLQIPVKQEEKNA